MEQIRRPKRARLDKLEVQPVDGPVSESLRFARGTVPQTPLRGGDLGLSITPRDLEKLVQQLKTPLSAISLEVCLLDATSAHSLDRVLRRIERNVAALEQVADELADIAAIEQDKLVLERRSNELRAFVGEVLDLAFGPHDRARCIVEAEGACLAWIDAPRIERVILTLVTGALAASARDAAVVIQLEQHGPTARLCMIHEGREPPPEGIAMYACRRIIEAHGGSLRVERRANAGTRVVVDLPVSAIDDRVHVLLVEDDPRQLDALAVLLQRAGLAVTTASCASAALLHARTLSLDAAIVDVELPDVAGSELVEQLRDSCPRLPIIVVSGHPADSACVVDARAACHGRYLAKPLDVEALLAEVGRFVRPR